MWLVTEKLKPLFLCCIVTLRQEVFSVFVDQMMGEVGQVYAVYASGDVLVMGKGKSWVFNPLCLSHTADDKEETTEDNPC